MHAFKAPDDVAKCLNELAALGAEIHTADWKQICVMCASGAREIDRLRTRAGKAELTIGRVLDALGVKR